MDYEHLQEIRNRESEIILAMLERWEGARLLEIGAGAGWQAKRFADAGYRVSAVDLAGSQYLGRAEFPILVYDGVRLPFEDGTFDVIFTSNVLEHVADLAALQEEMRRVLKKNGVALHVVPTGFWRFWTTLTHYPAAWRDARKEKRLPRWAELRQKRHGERGNLLTEIYFFSRHWWRRFFLKHGWKIRRVRSNRVFYTGNQWFGARLTWGVREKLGHFLGSSCHIFLLGRGRGVRKSMLPRPPEEVDDRGEGAEAHLDFGPEVLAIRRAISPYTMTGIEAVYALVEAVRHIKRHRIPGAVVECGVWKGGSMMATALALQATGEAGRELWLYDTFEGMPQPGEEDVDHSGGKAMDVFLEKRTKPDASAWCDAGLEEVKRNLASTGYDASRVRFVQGKVEATIPGNSPEQIAILRLDTDSKESTAHELRHLYPRVARGGIIIVDDYGHWRGARAAVDEFLAALEEAVFLHRVDKSVRLWMKP